MIFKLIILVLLVQIDTLASNVDTKSGKYLENFLSLEKRAINGDIKTQFILGTIFEEGGERIKNYKKAAYWYQKAADAGNINAQFNLARMYRHGLLPDEKNNELKYFQMAANNDHSEAQYILGIKYQDGEEVMQNWSEALKWYEKAAMNGEVLAQEKVGFTYFKGDVIKKDLDKSFFYLNKAAKNGSNEAKYVLSVMYSHGFATLKNDKEALNMLYESDSWGDLVWVIEVDSISNKEKHVICGENLQICKIEKSTVEYIRNLADKGDSKAQYVLGNMYYWGQDIQQNHYLSSKYLLQAARNGLQKAYIRFGEFFDILYKEEKYLIYQYALYNLALVGSQEINNELHLKNNLEKIEKKLSMTEILEAQRLSEEKNELWNALEGIIEIQKYNLK